MTSAVASEAITIARRKRFSAAHLYRQPGFTSEQNRETFGACYGDHGHGHDYVLEVYVSGEIDPATRMVMNLADLDRLMIEAVEPLEHRHLNFEVPEFSTTVPTTENIALYLRGRLLDKLAAFPKVAFNRLRLFETEDLWVEVRA